jgi:hypothetical protein
MMPLTADQVHCMCMSVQVCLCVLCVCVCVCACVCACVGVDVDSVLLIFSFPSVSLRYCVCFFSDELHREARKDPPEGSWISSLFRSSFVFFFSSPSVSIIVPHPFLFTASLLSFPSSLHVTLSPSFSFSVSLPSSC